MKLRTAAALSLALLAVPAVASADSKLEGVWHMDVKKTVDAMTARGTLPPDQLKEMSAMVAEMAKAFSLKFVGNRLEANTGEDVTKCDWSWGKDDEVVTKNCLDGAGKANDLDPATEMIQWKDGALLLINKPENMTMTFRRD